MLYQFNTTADLSKLPSTFPLYECIATKLELMAFEDSEGCILLAETIADLEAVRDIINIDVHPCEWAEYVGKDHQYILAVYQLNNDYGIDLYLPLSITPDNIKEEL